MDKRSTNMHRWTAADHLDESCDLLMAVEAMLDDMAEDTEQKFLVTPIPLTLASIHVEIAKAKHLLQ
jgi:thiamine pyrophosphate-dependent acetolactate synthase large subunit-like protein